MDDAVRVRLSLAGFMPVAAGGDRSHRAVRHTGSPPHDRWHPFNLTTRCGSLADAAGTGPGRLTTPDTDSLGQPFGLTRTPV